MTQTIVSASLLFLTAACACAQPPATLPSFETASIKPNDSGSGAGSTRVSNGEVILRNVPLRDCIEMAYNVNDARIAGPEWLATARFDIIAKPPSGTPHDQFRGMMQSLLLERFKLSVHRESKTLPVFAIVVGKGGHKLQPGEPGGAHVDGSNNRLTGKGMSMADLADNLAGRVDRPVVDQTGLDGVYDLHLEWSPDDTSKPADSPSLFTAIQEQLGLRLDSRKLPVDIVVVDHIEKLPTDN